MHIPLKGSVKNNPFWSGYLILSVVTRGHGVKSNLLTRKSVFRICLRC